MRRIVELNFDDVAVYACAQTTFQNALRAEGLEQLERHTRVGTAHQWMNDFISHKGKVRLELNFGLRFYNLAPCYIDLGLDRD